MVISVFARFISAVESVSIGCLLETSKRAAIEPDVRNPVEVTIEGLQFGSQIPVQITREGEPANGRAQNLVMQHVVL